jgi:DNA helicase IV
MQCRAVGRRCATGSATVLGDVAQATTAWAAGTWNETLRHLGKPGAVREELTQGFRVPKQVIEYAARLLPVTTPHLAPPTSVRQAEGALELCPVDDVAEALAIAAWEALAREGSIGVIAADAALPALSKSLRALDIAHAVLGAEEERETSGDGAEETAAGNDIAGTNTAGEDGADDPAAARLILVPASLAKGLEYDQVIVTEPADIVEAEYTELLGLRRLYVVLTRAVSRLTVLHARPLPAQLATA